MAQHEDQDWIVPGAQVAQYVSVGDHVTLTTVERLTATQIVLANGSRYRKGYYRREVGDKDGWRRRQLLPITDERVRRALASGAMSNLVSELDKLLRVRSTTATPADLLAKLDEAADRIAAARATVQKLTKED